MFFSQVRAYRLTNAECAASLTAEKLEEVLKTKTSKTPGSQDLSTAGFTAPLGKGEDAPLVFSADGFHLIALRKIERILPGSVVRDELTDKVDAIEAEQQRKVYKRERDQLKDEIIQNLLPHAFLRKTTTFASIAPEAGLIFINKAGYAACEDLLSTLRECLGSLPVRPVTTKIAPQASMTDWVKTSTNPEGFTILTDARLEDPSDEGGVIRVSNQDLSTEHMLNHLGDGMVVCELAIAYQDKASFVIDDSLAIKKLRFDDILKDQAAQDGGADADGHFAASLVLMNRTMLEIYPALLTSLGGEDIPEGI